MKYLPVLYVLLCVSCMANAEDVQSDMVITCEEMASYPKESFGYVDLGSGFGSPTQVDYNCPQSLITQEFMATLIELAEQIRSPESSRCGGSIVYLHSRVFLFDLAHLGYYPQGFSINIRDTGNYSTIYEYFKEWAGNSVYNYRLYVAYMAELDRITPILTNWYKNTHNVSDEQAKQYADTAIYAISSYTFGKYSSSTTPSVLIPGLQDALQGDMSLFWKEYPKATQRQKHNALSRLLLANVSTSIIKEATKDMNLENYPYFGEPLISFALFDTNNLALLLDDGYPVNNGNYFGKTLLYYAIQYELHDTVSLLLKNGADVNAKYIAAKHDYFCDETINGGRTPLMHAAQHADAAMMEILLNNGAELNAVDANKENALDYAEQETREENVEYLIPLLGLK